MKCSPLAVSGNEEEETGRASRSIPGCEPGVAGRILQFLIIDQFT